MKLVAVRLDDALGAILGRLLRRDLNVPVGERGAYYKDASFGIWLVIAAALCLVFAVTGPRNWQGAVVKAVITSVPMSMALLRGGFDALGQRHKYTLGGWPWVCSFLLAFAGGVAAFQP